MNYRESEREERDRGRYGERGEDGERERGKGERGREKGRGERGERWREMEREGERGRKREREGAREREEREGERRKLLFSRVPSHISHTSRAPFSSHVRVLGSPQAGGRWDSVH